MKISLLSLDYYFFNSIIQKLSETQWIHFFFNVYLKVISRHSLLYKLSSDRENSIYTAHSARTLQYTDCISAEENDPSDSVYPASTLNHLMVRLYLGYLGNVQYPSLTLSSDPKWYQFIASYL